LSQKGGQDFHKRVNALGRASCLVPSSGDKTFSWGIFEKRGCLKVPCKKPSGGNSPLDGFFGELPGLDERYFHPFKRLGIVGFRTP